MQWVSTPQPAHPEQPAPPLNVHVTGAHYVLCVQVGEYGRLKEQLLSQEELQASLSAKAAQLDASQARVSELELQLAQALEQGTSQSKRLATLQVI